MVSENQHLEYLSSRRSCRFFFFSAAAANAASSKRVRCNRGAGKIPAAALHLARARARLETPCPSGASGRLQNRQLGPVRWHHVDRPIQSVQMLKMHKGKFRAPLLRRWEAKAGGNRNQKIYYVRIRTPVLTHRRHMSDHCNRGAATDCRKLNN